MNVYMLTPSACKLKFFIILKVNLKSTNMEAHLFKKGVRNMVLVDEVCTDANVQIISILST